MFLAGQVEILKKKPFFMLYGFLDDNHPLLSKMQNDPRSENELENKRDDFKAFLPCNTDNIWY